MASKLKSIEKKMYNGVHETWTSDKGKYFKFTVVFENGDTGTAMSTKETPSWKIGTNYTYDKTTSEKGFVSIKSMKDADNPFGGGGGAPKGNFESYYDKPEVVKDISVNHALMMSIKFLELRDQKDFVRQDTIFKVANKIYDYYYKEFDETLPNNEKSKFVLRKRQALEQAIACNKIDCEWNIITSVNTLFALADSFIAYHETKTA